MWRFYSPKVLSRKLSCSKSCRYVLPEEQFMICYSWTAICRGAVIHGMSVEKMDSRFVVEVQSRICRASYGVICQEKWDETKHLPQDKFWDEDQQSWKAARQIKWFLKEVIIFPVNIDFQYNTDRFSGSRRDGQSQVSPQLY